MTVQYMNVERQREEYNQDIMQARSEHASLFVKTVIDHLISSPETTLSCFETCPTYVIDTSVLMMVIWRSGDWQHGGGSRFIPCGLI